MTHPGAGGERPVRVLRAIARLNMGGPAHHVSILSGRLDARGYETLLVSGEVGPGEESLDELVERHGVRHRRIGSLGPEIRPGRDARALRELVSVIREFRPDIVHTHTAKAGMVGRTAARAALGRAPVVLHTYHGHVLEGYFGPARNALYRNLERGLGVASDALVGVSNATVDDLVRLRIAPRRKFRVVPLGLELDAFASPPEGARAQLRGQLGVEPEELLLSFVGRLVPIKRVDLAIAAIARARSEGIPARLAVVGDGELRSELEAQARALGVDGAVSFLGYRTDLPVIAAAADAALLTSANEGTPVSLIEAGAAGLPSIATAVGGVPEVVEPETGIVVPAGDDAALAEAIARLAGDAVERERMGRAARERTLARYGAERLVTDVDGLYRELLRGRAGGQAGL